MSSIRYRLARVEQRMGREEMIIANPIFWPDSPPSAADIAAHQAAVRAVMANPKGIVVWFDAPGQDDPWGTLAWRKP